jgi:SAM-dependent methyltransferase
VREWLKRRFRYEAIRLRSLYRHRHGHPFSPKLPRGPVHKILNKHGLGFQRDGVPTWWYQAFEQLRNEEDALTTATLRYVRDNIDRDARILITGCGTGWMLIWLGQQGFRKIDGFDYLPNVAAAAQELAALGGVYARIWQDDGFHPTLEGEYDLVLALHWVFSAWMGNYGNTPRGDEDRQQLLDDFLAQYTGHIAPGGLMMVELIDSISDLLDPPIDVYPIRQSYEQVQLGAERAGFRIEKRVANVRYGYLPRMLYWLRRT